MKTGTLGRGEPELLDEDEYLVQKRGRDQESLSTPPFKRDQDERAPRANRYGKLRQVFHATVEDDDETDQMPSGLARLWRGR